MAQWPDGSMARSGITLLEMLIVVGLISLMVGISYPAISSGLESVRLRTAADSIVSFLNAALNRAERRQEVMEVTISKSESALVLRSAAPDFERRLDLPDGVSVSRVLPERAVEDDAPRRFYLYPGGTVPRFGVEIRNRRGAKRTVMVDPITGAPRIEEDERE